MKNVIETLERYYRSFRDQEKSWEFFLGLADYINFILKTPILKDITDKVMKKQKDEYKKIEKLEEKSLQELEKAKNKLLKIITDCNISPNSLLGKWSLLPGVSGGLLNELEQFEKGKISVGGFKSDTLEDYLFDIAKSIAEQGYRDTVKEFIVSDREYEEYRNVAGNVYGNFVFSKSLKLRTIEQKSLERKKQIEIWGALYPLLIAHKAMIDEEKIEDELSKDTKITLQKQFEYTDLLSAMGDARKMREINELGEFLSRDSLYLLERDKYKNYAQRFHNYLIQELNKEPERKEIISKKEKTKYIDGILYFKSKQIDFRNKPNQKELLKTILEEPEKNWSYDEIQESWDNRWEDVKATNPNYKNYWKKFYSAGDDINKAIAVETQVKDFIIKNTKEIRINPKYI